MEDWASQGHRDNLGSGLWPCYLGVLQPEAIFYRLARPEAEESGGAALTVVVVVAAAAAAQRLGPSRHVPFSWAWWLRRRDVGAGHGDAVARGL